MATALPRALETRAQETRERTQRVWRPASTLPTPNPEQGYVFRWIMTHLLGEVQPTNLSQRIREGYEPVKAVDHPELGYEADKNGNINVGGLMLCKIPAEMIAQRQDYYQQMTNNQSSAAQKKFLGMSDARMPVFAESKTESSRGRAFGNGN